MRSQLAAIQQEHSVREEALLSESKNKSQEARLHEQVADSQKKAVEKLKDQIEDLMRKDLESKTAVQMKAKDLQAEHKKALMQLKLDLQLETSQKINSIQKEGKDAAKKQEQELVKQRTMVDSL